MSPLTKRSAAILAPMTAIALTVAMFRWVGDTGEGPDGLERTSPREPAREPPGGTPERGPLLKTWAPANEGAGHPSRARAVETARRFDLLVVSPESFARAVGGMRRAHPGIKILAYVNAAFVGWSDGGAYPASWYARDERGRRIRSVGFGNWLMDISNPAWRRNRAARCASLLSEAAYDGCMLDLLGTAPLLPGYATSAPVDPRSGEPWDKASWLAATSSIADAVARRVDPALVVGNGLGNGPLFFDGTAPTSVLLRELDGVIAESWLRSPRQELDAYPSLARWSSDVRMLEVAETSGSDALILTKAWASGTRAEKDRLHEFALASFLLATNGDSFFHFSYAPGSDPTVGHAWWRVDIGSPIGPFRVVDGVYRRRFTAGIVVVNPTSEDRTLDVGGRFRDLTGEIVSSGAPLPAHTGLVLSAVAT